MNQFTSSELLKGQQDATAALDAWVGRTVYVLVNHPTWLLHMIQYDGKLAKTSDTFIGGYILEIRGGIKFYFSAPSHDESAYVQATATGPTSITIQKYMGNNPANGLDHMMTISTSELIGQMAPIRGAQGRSRESPDKSA